MYVNVNYAPFYFLNNCQIKFYLNQSKTAILFFFYLKI